MKKKPFFDTPNIFDREIEIMFNELSEFLIIQNFKDFKTFNTLMQYLAGDLQVGKAVCYYIAKCFSTLVAPVFMSSRT